MLFAALFSGAASISSRASEPESRALILLVVGASGEEAFAKTFANSEKLWRAAAEKGGAEVVTIGLGAVANAESDEDRRAVQKFCERFEQPATAPGWVVLIGHGTDNGREAKFNLRGPDFSAVELAEWLKPARRPLVIVNSASASGAFLKPLAGTNRIVITATRSGSEMNFAHFGGFMAESIGSLEADFDKDNQTSALEAFLMASRKVADFYKEEGRLATEHALIDDNGDGLGTPGDWFQGVRAVKKAQNGASVDGRRAHQAHLISNAEDRQLSAADRARRDELEMEIAKLRDRKNELAGVVYWRELEGLLLELARLYERSEAQ